MPVALRVGEGEFLDERAFRLEVGDHLFHGDMIIGDGRGFAVAGETVVGELDDEGRLVRFGAAGNCKRVTECQVIRMVVTGHGTQN